MTCPHGPSAERRRLSRPAGAPLQRGEGVKIPRHGRPNTFHGLSAERKSLAIGRKRRKKPHAARRSAAPSHVPRSLSGGCPFVPFRAPAEATDGAASCVLKSVRRWPRRARGAGRMAPRRSTPRRPPRHVFHTPESGCGKIFLSSPRQKTYSPCRAFSSRPCSPPPARRLCPRRRQANGPTSFFSSLTTWDGRTRRYPSGASRHPSTRATARPTWSGWPPAASSLPKPMPAPFRHPRAPASSRAWRRRATA